MNFKKLTDFLDEVAGNVVTILWYLIGVVIFVLLPAFLFIVVPIAWLFGYEFDWGFCS